MKKPAWIAKETNAALAAACCTARRQDTHKGDYGKIMLLCGAVGYTGAPALAAKAAVRSGAGLVFVGVPQSVYPIIAAKLDSPVVFPLPDQGGRLSAAALPEIISRLKHMDACLLGPGLGRGAEVEQVIWEILRQCRCPLVLDADGINAIASAPDKLPLACCPLILTPHEGEFRRLTAAPEKDRISGAVTLAQQLSAVILRKGHETIITDGRRIYVNHTGNAGMAVGGSGDVLAGILTALLGQGNAPLQAAAAAAWLHGRAGDLAAAELGQYALTPGDLIGKLPQILP